MHIFIPTRGRLDDQVTLGCLYGNTEREITVVVPACEYAAWEKMQDKVWPDIELAVVPNEWGICNIRQHILEEWDGRHLVLDDDLRFYVRKAKDDWHLRYLEDSEVEEMIDAIDALFGLDIFHGAISCREGNNRLEGYLCENTRAIRANFYDSQIVRSAGVRYDDVELMEDFHFTLSLLERGYKNAVLVHYAQGQRTSNAPGGCSEYRTLERHEKAAHRLQELHPQFVTTVRKQTKTAWNGQERTDVRMQWKKAFNPKARFRVRRTK